MANRLDAAKSRRAAAQQNKKQRLERNLKRAADRRAAVLQDSRERARSVSAVRPNAKEAAELNTVCFYLHNCLLLRCCFKLAGCVLAWATAQASGLGAFAKNKPGALRKALLSRL